VGPAVLTAEAVTAAHYALSLHDALPISGSTAVFQNMWKVVADNLKNMKYYPRIVGETGGKDFIFAHSSADVDALVVAAIRGAVRSEEHTSELQSREKRVCRLLLENKRTG